jgi:serine/threonine protein kinase
MTPTPRSSQSNGVVAFFPALVSAVSPAVVSQETQELAMASQDGLFDSTVTLPGDETSFPDSQDAPNPNQEHAALTVLRILNHTLSQDIPYLPIDYKLRREQDTPRPYALGRGTFCDVFTHVVKGHEALSVPNVQRGDIVALKQPPQPRDPSSAALKNCLTGIQREIDLALHPSLRCHRNICRLLYIGWEAKFLIPILAFPTATYGTLEDFLCGSSKGRGTVEAAVRAVLTSDIACGLLALHDHGFVHRDLKTTNILVDGCPVNKVPAVLTNFSGSIRQSRGSSTADDGHGHITPKWAAPEELAGEPIDQYSRCDVYSFGLVIVTLWMAGYT